MVAWARDARRGVVIGGGLLGLEAGRGLVERGLDVEIVHRADRLMNLQLDTEAAAMLRESVEELGMRVRLNASAERLIGEECVQGVELADGTRIACEMVVFATGIRPNAELAARAGLRSSARSSWTTRSGPSAAITCTRSGSARSTAATCPGCGHLPGSRRESWPT